MVNGLIGLEELRISCIIGELPYEREQTQEIVLSFRVTTDFAAASKQDNIEDALDYTLLAKAAEEVAQNGQFRLLETLAWHILEIFVSQFRVSWAWVRIRKPSALPGKGVPVVELERGVRAS